MKKHENYPNKADFEPNVDKHGKTNADLPLSDPAESNETEVFRENEYKETEKDIQKPSAYGEHKTRK
ncbi:hypothetical protein JSQ81_14325 [Sporosarcina sp. Marseille-Q4063]|uniref:hypothetical protein n=1 Tax=Sporosarcina sp. Marseille-Q4063 TaxID=2810514 RepID=UPI001BB0AB1C|nr:hypothetical protein [Sporosarcina sp. Marseille-Q4063]QUW20984.1 hypothetical protein JSQ81_14325 [Sporosarcina sp. Marseille-Q4063]